ncbi:MAG: alpha-ketoglutarate-dependent dioxygenase AlkB [Rhizonema sp. NSF051]|nr:alpha-ketoglutarate-dependent dioxygenase AlkB [Rhizonema sp. NSF051]
MTGYRFNIVIGNLYRDSRDSIGWHSDAEKSMGTRPAIASLSLGAERKFQIRSNDKKHSYDFWLGHGSLLVMQPGCQSNWKHQVQSPPLRVLSPTDFAPKTSSLIGRRVNLTFRPHVKGKARGTEAQSCEVSGTESSVPGASREARRTESSRDGIFHPADFASVEPTLRKKE